MLTIAEDEDVYKLSPEIEITEAGIEVSSNTAIPEPPPAVLTPNSRKPTSPPSRQEAGSAAAEASDEEITLSPNMRKIFTRLQKRRLLTPGGGSSAISGPASQSNDRTALKKHCTT